MRVKRARRLPVARQFWYLLRHAQRLSVRGECSFYLAQLTVNDAMAQAFGALAPGEFGRIYSIALADRARTEEKVA